MRVPVLPPTSPVATTGTPSAFSARATLMPLPAGERDAVARAMPLPPLEVRNGQCPVDRRVECDGDDHQKRFPRWWSVLPAYQRTRPTRPGLLIVREATRSRVPTRRDPRRISTWPRTSPCRTGSETARRGDDRLRQGPAEPRDRQQRTGRDELERRLAVADRGGRVDASQLDGRHDTELREPPDQQRLEVVVPVGARRAAEQRRVDRDAAAARRSDLAPPREVRVTGLDADRLREDREQVVPRVQRPAAGDRRRLLAARSRG